MAACYPFQRRLLRAPLRVTLSTRRRNGRINAVQNGKIDGAHPSMPVYLVPLRAQTVPCSSRKFPVRITVFVGNTGKRRGRLAYHFLLCVAPNFVPSNVSIPADVQPLLTSRVVSVGLTSAHSNYVV